MNERKIQDIFNEWLFMTPEQRATHNPFKKMLGDALQQLPKVKQPKF